LETFNQNNIVKVGGIIISELEFSHEVFDEKFLKFNLEVERISDSKDILPIIVSERLVNKENIKIGVSCFVEGQFRSYNQIDGNKNKLILSVFAKEILFNLDNINKINEIVLEGFICKKPVYRKTPLGREISDVLVAVNRTYKKSDYIPCILWGRNAKFSQDLDVGCKVRLTGRIQARNYEKTVDGNVIKQVAYEVSVSKFGISKNEDIQE
jgi:primosomal replication protein N